MLLWNSSSEFCVCVCVQVKHLVRNRNLMLHFIALYTGYKCTNAEGSHSTVVGHWTAKQASNPASGAWFIPKFHLISPGCPQPSVAAQCRIVIWSETPSDCTDSWHKNSYKVLIRKYPIALPLCLPGESVLIGDLSLCGAGHARSRWHVYHRWLRSGCRSAMQVSKNIYWLLYGVCGRVVKAFDPKFKGKGACL